MKKNNIKIVALIIIALLAMQGCELKINDCEYRTLQERLYEKNVNAYNETVELCNHYYNDKNKDQSKPADLSECNSITKPSRAWSARDQYVYYIYILEVKLEYKKI